jgi:hypothetical protein
MKSFIFEPSYSLHAVIPRHFTDLLMSSLSIREIKDQSCGTDESAWLFG